MEGKDELGFVLHPRRSRRYPERRLKDLDFVDDITLLASDLHSAQEFLLKVEKQARTIGLELNAKKTEVMVWNIDSIEDENTNIKITNGHEVKRTEDFKYLGAWIGSSSKDIMCRIGLAWSACNRLSNIWSSKLDKLEKLRIFVATVESVLLYGCETWTISVKLERKLDGTYAKLLRKVQNFTWNNKVNNID